MANYWEKRPQTSTITWEFAYDWQDEEWMKSRHKANALDAPWSVYEVHLASWMRPDAANEEEYNTTNISRSAW
jgi:1,4-alpha-glucan branching enzyme